MSTPSANPKEFIYEVLYYEGYGVSEAARITAHAGGLTQVNEFVTDDTLPSYKPSLLFGQVPRLRVKDKAGTVVFEIVQSRAIAKYLANLTGLAGNNAEETAQIDQWYEAIRDSNEVASKVWWRNDRHTVITEVTKPDGPLHAHAKKYDEFLKKSSSGFLVLDKLTLADLVLFLFTEETAILLGGAGFASYKHLIAHREKIASIPTVKAYVNDPKRVTSFYAQPDLY